MHRKSLILSFGLVALGFAAPVSAQDLLGPLANVVDQQLITGWEASTQDGWFALSNDSLEGSEQTLTINAGPPPADGRETMVTVSLNSQIATAAIGVLARSATNDDVCLMEITAEAKANLFCVIGGDYQSIASVDGVARMDGSDIITMVDVPGAARFFVNDTQIGDVTYASALGGEIGIMAYERGTFGIADFRISDLTAPSGGTTQSGGGSGLPPKGGSGGQTTGSDTSGGSGGGDDRMAGIMGPLADAISNADAKDGWELFFEDNWLVIVNSATASSERVFTMPVGPLNSGQRVTTLEVGVLPPQGEKASDFPLSAAGILIESSDKSNSCIGEITGAGDGLVLCFGPDGKSTENRSPRRRGQGRRAGRAAIHRRTGYGEFRLNGETIGQISNDPALGGDIGVLAYERGEFYVGGFSITEGSATSAGGSSPLANRQRSAVPCRCSGRPGPPYRRLSWPHQQHLLPRVRSCPDRRIADSVHGPEEDAVDIYSALKVVDPTMYPSDDEQTNAIGREVAMYSALQWYYSGKLAEEQGSETPWQDEHTPDLKRFRNVFCVMYGGNPAMFSNLAEQIGFDENTLARCDEEFNKQSRAWRTILAPHTRVDAWNPEGQLPVDAPGAAVEVVFEQSQSAIGQFLVETMGDGLKGFAADLSKTYALPRTVTVTYKDCGELNAWYDPSEGSITMCYDLIEYLAIMISDIEMGTVQGADAGGAAPTSSVPGSGGAASTNVSLTTSGSSGIDELADLGVPPTNVLFPAPYKGPTPSGHTKAELLTTEGLASAINDGISMLLIDTSGRADTIPGAIGVSDAGKDGSLTDRFQSAVDSFLQQETKGDTKMPVVFFGTGLQDRSAYNGALRAGALGWTAYWYRGGIEAWQANGLPLAPAE
jgi:rhodanese-related sulfurtransferase